jgi:hypothetical protein
MWPKLDTIDRFSNFFRLISRFSIRGTHQYRFIPITLKNVLKKNRKIQFLVNFGQF